jgi:hypothetical protein
MIFTGTFFTHGKGGHGGFRSVVRHVTNYGIARPAIGTVNKRVQVSPVLLVKEFPEAVAAGCCVWGYKDCSLFALFAGFYFETGIIGGRQFLGVYLSNNRQGWGRFGKFLKKALEGHLAPFYFYFNTLWRVGHIAV